MVIGKRIRELREQKKLSQGDMEKRTGLLRCYISRVENGHTVPSIETLEKCARALEIPCTGFSMRVTKRQTNQTCQLHRTGTFGVIVATNGASYVPLPRRCLGWLTASVNCCSGLLA